MALSDKLLEILVCPKCKGPLEYDKKNNKLLCQGCGLKFRIEDDIPVLLTEEAESL